MASREFVEQRLRFLQVTGVEALCEPPVDRRKQCPRVRDLALTAPEPGKSGCGAQLEQLCTLAPRQRDCRAVARLGSYALTGENQQITAQPVSFGQDHSLLRRFGHTLGLGEVFKASLR